MSFEELMKSPEGGSVWKIQRDKLFHLTFTLCAAALLVIGAIVLVFALKKHQEGEALAARKSDATRIAALMRIQKEASELKDGVTQVRGTASVGATKWHSRTGADARARARVAPLRELSVTIPEKDSPAWPRAKRIFTFRPARFFKRV